MATPDELHHAPIRSLASLQQRFQSNFKASRRADYARIEAKRSGLKAAVRSRPALDRAFLVLVQPSHLLFRSQPRPSHRDQTIAPIHLPNRAQRAKRRQNPTVYSYKKA